jgi:hypothetical protein
VIVIKKLNLQCIFHKEYTCKATDENPYEDSAMKTQLGPGSREPVPILYPEVSVNVISNSDMTHGQDRTAYLLHVAENFEERTPCSAGEDQLLASNKALNLAH